MVIRNGMYLSGGYDYTMLISIDILLIATAITVGLIHFVRTDIFNKSEWRI